MCSSSQTCQEVGLTVKRRLFKYYTSNFCLTILDIIKAKRNSFRTILVGNKTDLESERKVNIWDVNRFIGRHNSTGWSLRHIECNSKNLTSFKKMMDHIVNGLTKINTPASLRKTDFNLGKSVKTDGVFGWILNSF